MPCYFRKRQDALCWIWPFTHSQKTGNQIFYVLQKLKFLCESWRWIVFVMLSGCLPLIFSYFTGIRGHQIITAILLLPTFLYFVSKGKSTQGFCSVVLCFLVHSIIAIYISAINPVAMAKILPDADEYWQKNLCWIRTGEDPEYELANWVPAHFRLMSGVIILSFTSLGIIPFYEGFYEVDLMNFYVGQLVRSSRNCFIVLGIGWHIWSIFRGISYAILIFEVVSISLKRITGASLSSSMKQHFLRWKLAMLFFFFDGLSKLFLLDITRRILFSNLT